jgi:hypothetical protein
MTKFTWTLTLASLLAAAVPAIAQDDTHGDAAAIETTEQKAQLRPSLRRDDTPSLGSPTPSVETWLYEQERKRYLDPKEAVRRNAEYRATQRQRRIESRNWFGVSNSRPIASPNPWYETYSPMWTGNSWHPYEWSGTGGPSVVYRPGWHGTQY